MILSNLLAHTWAFGALLLCFTIALAFYRSAWHKRALWAIPGPKSYALSSIPLAVASWKAQSIHTIHQLHQKHGPAVRVMPDQISFNSLTALRTIYGAGSPFERTSFYSMFDVYGRPNLFTFASGIDHRERKKLVSHMYSNQIVLGNHYGQLVKNKVAAYLALIENEPAVASEIFSSLHYFSLDAISEFVYGPLHGGTAALKGNVKDREMIRDILDPARRRLSWFLVHFPAFTRFLVTRTGVAETVLNRLGLMPMKKPFTYTGIRKHALEAFHHFNSLSAEEQAKHAESTVIGRLFAVRERQCLGDMDIASECADHLLAGIDTTADSMLFLIWVLSLPQHQKYQDRLRHELSHISVDEQGIPEPKALTQLPLLNAVLKEALRLYSPLPAFEPRSCAADALIDGYYIPAGTVVGMSPYCLHREASVFVDPLRFRPDRWLNGEGTRLIPESDVKNRYFWAFSSGARMCIGMHLANAEMLTLTAALFRKYKTFARHPHITPGITSRYEIFCDETTEQMEEHQCWIDFVKI
ncbi:hypothetical protein DV735_g1165, partial [Chaetothyriales sp. CBS 134920]